MYLVHDMYMNMTFKNAQISLSFLFDAESRHSVYLYTFLIANRGRRSWILIDFFRFCSSFLDNRLRTEISFLWRWWLSGLGAGRNTFDAIRADINKAEATHATGGEEHSRRRNSGKCFVFHPLQVKTFQITNFPFLFCNDVVRKRNSKNHLRQTRMIWSRWNRPFPAFASFW